MATGCASSTIPAAFDRAGLYGDAAGDYADNAWRFGLYGRAALEALRADGRPVDVLHLHDWQAGPVAVFRALRYADDPIVGRAAIVDDPAQPRLPRLDRQPGRAASSGSRPGDGAPGQNADGIDLLAAAIEDAELVNTVSPGYAREALTPEFGMGLDGAAARARATGSSASSTGSTRASGTQRATRTLRRRTARSDRAGMATCRADLLDPRRDGPGGPGAGARA